MALDRRRLTNLAQDLFIDFHREVDNIMTYPKQATRNHGFKWMAKAVIIIALIAMQGCVNMAMTSAQAVYNRHSIQKNFKDQYTSRRVFQALYLKTDEFKNANISISTFNGEVLLAGQVPESWQKSKANQIVKNLPNIGIVHNLLTVASPSSTLTKLSDAWLTAKVKARLIASSDVDATQIKVVTENGTVYLMGILHTDQAEAAVNITRTTGGVQSVVKIFSYLELVKKPNKAIA